MRVLRTPPLLPLRFLLRFFSAPHPSQKTPQQPFPPPKHTHTHTHTHTSQHDAAGAAAASAAGRCVYFARVNPRGVAERTLEADIAAGDVPGARGALDAVRALVADVYLPVLREQAAWGKAPPARVRDFLAGAGRFSAVLAGAAGCLDGGAELAAPDARLAAFDARPGAYTAAAADPEAARAAEACLGGWCRQIEALLAEADAGGSGQDGGGGGGSGGSGGAGGGEGTASTSGGSGGSGGGNAAAVAPDLGPDSELAFWRRRMAVLNSVEEQLKAKEAKVVVGTCHVMHSATSKRWKVRAARAWA